MQTIRFQFPFTMLSVLFLMATQVRATDSNPTLLLGVEKVKDETVYDVPADPVVLLLSRHRYPVEDRHLDAIVWVNALDELEYNDRLQFQLLNEESVVLAEESIWLRDLPGNPLYLSARFPDGWVNSSGRFKVDLYQSGKRVGGDEDEFSVYVSAPKDVSRQIDIVIPNTEGLHISRLPVSVGIPFPRGLVENFSQLSLRSSTGEVIVADWQLRNRWSRFGSYKWAFVTFIADVDHENTTYTVHVSESSGGSIEVDSQPKQSLASSQLLELYPMLSEDAFRGAYVTHANGQRYQMPEDMEWKVEESGPVRVVLKSEGWYLDRSEAHEFCRYVSRVILYKGAPAVRIFHTWIYTGDPEEDRVAEMGWRFDLADKSAGRSEVWVKEGLSSVGVESTYVGQIDSDQFRLKEANELIVKQGKAQGTMSLRGSDGVLWLGVKDFWQNFPREIEYADGALYVREWPRYGVSNERPLTPENALHLWFAHEGEVMDLSVPERYIADKSLIGNNARDGYLMNDGEFGFTVNAQGIAKTMEVLLWLDSGDQDGVDADSIAGMLNGDLQAFVDPQLLADSGAFYEIHPRDTERFEAEESVYEAHALAPIRWIERIDLYGKWIWGDMTWRPDLDAGEPGLLYRGFRKAHQGWPYSWLPFVRSGDNRFKQMADAATRYMTDVPYIHYADDEAVISVGSGSKRNNVPRSRGRLIRYGIPWGSHQYWRGPDVRGYTDKVDYLWHSYHLTGYPRAKDVLMDWAELTKVRGDFTDPVFEYPEITSYSHYPRNTLTLLQAYVQMYEETFDPWFLAAAYQIAHNVHLKHLRDQGIGEGSVRPGQWFWHPGPREFQRFSGSPEYRELYMEYARRFSDPRLSATGWARLVPMLEAPAYAYHLTGDQSYLSRIRAWVDYTEKMTYTGEPDYYKGGRVGTVLFSGVNYTPYYLNTFPFALHALATVEKRPTVEATGFFQAAAKYQRQGGKWTWHLPTIAVQKSENVGLPLDFEVRDSSGRPDQSGAFRFSVQSPGGEVIHESDWLPVMDRYQWEIPAQATAGDYRIFIEGATERKPQHSGYGNRSAPSVLLPLTPSGVPEVLEVPAGEWVGPSHYYAQYWFYPPERELSFDVKLQNYVPGHSGLVRITLSDEGGSNLWLEELHQAEMPERRQVTVRVPQNATPKDGLMCLAIPNFHNGFRSNDHQPMFYAISPDRWFEPKPNNKE